MRDVWVIGIGQTPVGEHWDRSLSDLAGEAVKAAIHDAGVSRVDALFVGNMLAGEFSHQEHLGAFLADQIGLRGIEGAPVRVEAQLSRGLPGLTLVGLAGAATRESRERVLGALRESGFQVPAGRATVNLSPAEEPKEGTAFDLAMALGLLEVSDQIRPRRGRDWWLVGELGLDGKLKILESEEEDLKELRRCLEELLFDQRFNRAADLDEEMDKGADPAPPLESDPVAEEETHVLLFEPATTLNTGNVETEKTRKELERI